MKRYIPGTNPKWGRELPEGYDNSLVDSAGKNWDNGYNFDERSDDEEEFPEFDKESAEKARQKALQDHHEKTK